MPPAAPDADGHRYYELNEASINNPTPVPSGRRLLIAPRGAIAPLLATQLSKVQRCVWFRYTRTRRSRPGFYQCTLGGWVCGKIADIGGICWGSEDSAPDGFRGMQNPKLSVTPQKLFAAEYFFVFLERCTAEIQHP